MQRIRLMLDLPTLTSFFTGSNWDGFEIVSVFDAAGPGPPEARRLRPDAVVINGQGKTNAGLVAGLRRTYPASVIIVWASATEAGDVASAIEAGADSYLLNENTSPAELVEVLKLICQAGVSVFPRSAADFLTRARALKDPLEECAKP
ncbi:MAG: hypothetical protein AB1426_06665 [Bacillota bacterium]